MSGPVVTFKDFERRALAMETVKEIMRHPGYPFDNDTHLAMIAIIARALKTWEERPK